MVATIQELQMPVQLQMLSGSTTAYEHLSSGPTSGDNGAKALVEALKVKHGLITINIFDKIGHEGKQLLRVLFRAI